MRSESFEWEAEDKHDYWRDDGNFLEDAGHALKLAALAPFSSIELIGKSMQSEVSENDVVKFDTESKYPLDWGTGEEWLEEICHVFKLSVTAPVTCIELLGSSLHEPPDNESNPPLSSRHQTPPTSARQSEEQEPARDQSEDAFVTIELSSKC